MATKFRVLSAWTRGIVYWCSTATFVYIILFLLGKKRWKLFLPHKKSGWSWVFWVIAILHLKYFSNKFFIISPAMLLSHGEWVGSVKSYSYVADLTWVHGHFFFWEQHCSPVYDILVAKLQLASDIMTKNPSSYQLTIITSTIYFSGFLIYLLVPIRMKLTWWEYIYIYAPRWDVC